MASADFVTHLPVVLSPNSGRTVIRPFTVEDPGAFAVEGHSRAQRIVDRILSMDGPTLESELNAVEAKFSAPHPGARKQMRERFEELDGLTGCDNLTPDQALLIGAYFSEEFSFESAALFNPSVVPHPDQTGAPKGALRFVLSLRGIGEGHVSSLTFRTGLWNADGSVEVDDASAHAIGPRVERSTLESGEMAVHLTNEGVDGVSEMVIYPFMPSQGRGIEDVRFVHFTEEDGTTDYRATYTAFDGNDVRQAILRTTDFMTFEARGVLGSMYNGKGMALFPRRVGGRFMMLGRQDSENIWLLSSDDLYTWNGGQKIIAPKWPWEFIQMGNCGSPIELDEGWLVLTHGVGVMRNYCVGACLLDKDDPSKVLARMTQPLLEPMDKARDGYVPNVVYSCGAYLRDRTLLLPYGVADNFATFATVSIDGLLASMA